jgi:hypothetical protein
MTLTSGLNLLKLLNLSVMLQSNKLACLCLAKEGQGAPPWTYWQILDKACQLEAEIIKNILWQLLQVSIS